MSKKPLIIFGAGDIAQLAHYYFTTDSEYEVAGFAVDAGYLKENVFCGLPVVPFEEVTQHFAPSEYDFFVALSYSQINQLRRSKYQAAKEKGYALASYISSRATVLNDGHIGENCFILEDNTIQPFVTIGHNVTLWSGNHIGHHSTVHDHCFIASHVVVSGGVTIDERCFIGVNATLRDHIRIGAGSVIGAGALVMSDVAEDGLLAAKPTERASIPASRLKKI